MYSCRFLDWPRDARSARPESVSHESVLRQYARGSMRDKASLSQVHRCGQETLHTQCWGGTSEPGPQRFQGHDLWDLSTILKIKQVKKGNNLLQLAHK